VITDAAIAILTAARSQARITLAAVAAGIAVSFVADTGAVVRLPAVGEGSPSNSSKTAACSGGGAMEQPVTAAIIEDHPVVTEGVASWIRSDPGQRVRLVQTARDLTGLRAVSRPSADVVILDLELSGELVTTQIPAGAAGYRVVASPGTAIRRS